ncbi:hypothetical protein [Tabrizicola sp.]|uniref:hypothetical protein n=1 Tax=Tabrizicola sp. TaxID=2005166 RepID=UPI0035B210F4
MRKCGGGFTSGRTPTRLIAALSAQPMLGAALAGQETSTSPATVLRSLDLLTAGWS